MTNLEVIDISHLALVTGGAGRKQQPQQPQDPGGGQDPGAGAGAGGFDINSLLSAIQQGLSGGQSIVGGFQSILSGFQQIAQLFQQFMPQGQGSMTAQGGQPQGGADQQAA